jgi:ribonucleoside-diphosphate reductase alpha chain
MKKIAKSGGLHGIDEVSDHIHSVFVTSHDITPEWHVKMQAAFQKYTDNAVSKTVNLKNEATVDDVREVFIAAYKTGCKGVTIYRDGSRGSQVLNIGKVNTNEESTQGKLSITPRPRPDITNGFTEKVKTGCGNLYITVNYDENGICEVFTNTGRAGGCPSQSEATARLVSIALRSGMDAESIIEQMKGIRCPSTIRQRGMKVLSCPDAIGRLIEKVMIHQNGNGKSMNKEDIKLNSFSSQTQPVMASIKKPGIRGERDKRNYYNDNCCPECGEPVEHEGGCKICRSCGYSKCG